VFRASGLRDADGIARFKEFHGQIGIQDNGIKFVSRRDIAATIDEFVLGFDGFGSAAGVGANRILEDDYVAGTANGVIGLRGDD